MKTSVVICTFNRSHCVGKAIASVLAQSLRPVEVIVVNDGSSDDTAEFLTRTYGEKIHLISKPNEGLPIARNVGVAAASGDWIAFLDDDDWWPVGKLENQAEALQRYPEVVAVASNIQFDEKRGASQNLYEMRGFHHLLEATTLIPRPLLFALKGCVLPSAVSVRREVLLKTGGFPAGRHVKLEDLDCFWKVALEGPWATVDGARVNMCRNDGDGLNYSQSVLQGGRLGLWMDLAQRCRDILNDQRLTLKERRGVNRRFAATLLELAVRMNGCKHPTVARRYALASLLKRSPGRSSVRAAREIARSFF